MKVKILQIIHMFHFLNILKLCEKKVTLESGKTKLINHCETYFSSVYQQPIQKRKGNLSKLMVNMWKQVIMKNNNIEVQPLLFFKARKKTYTHKLTHAKASMNTKLEER